jgi:hypothetical protein
MLFHFHHSLIKLHLLEDITLYLFMRYLLHAASVFSLICSICSWFFFVKFYKFWILVVLLILLVLFCSDLWISVWCYSFFFLSAICKNVLLIYVTCHVYVSVCYFIFILMCRPPPFGGGGGSIGLGWIVVNRYEQIIPYKVTYFVFVFFLCRYY